MRRTVFQFIAIGGMVLFFPFTQVFAQPAEKATIKGTVVDYSSGKPIQDANVFLANTMIGDATDSDGNFFIENIPLGSHELIVSFIGYEVKTYPLRFTTPIVRKFKIKLKQKVIDVPEIAVSADKIKDWQKNLKKFKKLFLGTSKNARQCEIGNAEVLDFIPEKGAQPFRAIAQAPLEIENKALGYRLTFILQTFEAKNTEVKYTGKALFEEIAEGGRQHKVQWVQNRIDTYRGSLRHFITSLYNNRHKQEGFLAYQLPVFPQGDEKVNRTEIKSKDLLKAGELSFEREFRLENFLEIIYTKEMEEEGFIEYRMSLDPSLINLDPETYRRETEPKNQRSLIALNTYSVIVDSTGLIDNPFGLTIWGYWSWERVADMLPLDYEAPFYTREMIAADANRDFYAEGLEKRKAGDWRAALETWERGQKSMALRGVDDPRIGIAYIELAAEKEAADKYELATGIYLWSLSESPVKKYKKELEEEIRMIQPLLTDAQLKEWQRDFKKGDRALYAKMKTFWIAKDPTPSTLLNERLIEHWQRIAYSRKNFKKSISTIYGTDDRGTVYVKYGRPDRQRTVTLGTNMAELHRWARPDLGEEMRVEVTTSQNQEQDMLGGGEEPQPIRALEITGINVQEIESRLRTEMAKYNYLPECEIWAYTNLDEKQDIIFVFGPEDGHGSFGLRNGIEELIPSRAFNTMNLQLLGGILPGGVLQMIYYTDIIAFDETFSRRYNTLEASWIRAYKNGKLAPEASVLKLHRTNFLAEDRFNPPYKYATPDQTEYRKTFRPIRLISSRARFLDENDKPYLLFTAIAFPQNLSQFRTDEMLNIEVTFDYALQYSLIVRDENLDEVQRVSTQPIASLDHTAVLKIDHTPQQYWYTLATEAFPKSSEEADQNPDRLPGIGQEQFGAIAPLKTNPKKLEISDLVIGVEPPADFDQSLLPFPIVPSTQIWKVDALKIYFEVYHLKLTETGQAQFSLELRVFKLNKKDNKYQRKEMTSSVFDFGATGSTAKETFGISIANLKKGEYELEVEVKDKNSGKKKSRKARFTVME
jgi:GWxTD domain-containing protein